MNTSEGTEVLIGGMITRVKKTVTKNGRSAGQSMAMITIEDLEGQMDGVLFAETYADVLKKYPGTIENESIVLLRGKIDRRRETPSIVVSDVVPLDQAPAKLTTVVAIKFDRLAHSPDSLKQLPALLRKHKGNVDVFAQVETDREKVTMKLPRDLNVRPTTEFVAESARIFGNGAVQLFGAGQRRLRRIQQQPLFPDAARDETTVVSDEQIAEVIDSELN